MYSYTAVFGASVALPVIYVLYTVVYRLFFHPFAKYPGPFWAKITYLYPFYHAWTGDTMQAQLRCHEQYGEVVRYGPDRLLFRQPEAQKEIHGASRNFEKGSAYHPMNAQPGTRHIAFTPHKMEHARRRRIISQGFSDRAVKDQQSYIRGHVDKFCDLVLKDTAAGSWSEPFDAFKPLLWMGMDINTDQVFGESYSMLEKPDYREFGDVIHQSLRRNSLITGCPALFKPGIGKWLDFGTWFLPDSVQLLQRLMSVGAQTALKRLEVSEKGTVKRDDVLSYLINSTDPETGTAFEPQEVITEAMVLLLAGGDTTANGISILFFYLVRYRAVLDKLAAELRSTFATADDIQLGEKMDNCTYLQACVQEGLRMFAATAFWRDAGSGGAHVQGHYIPEGMTAGTSFYALVHREEIFPDSYKFVPERWIPGGEYSDDQIKAAKVAAQPFSLGPRSCVAKNLGMAVLLLGTATIVWRMDLKKPEGDLGRVGEGGPHLGKGRERADQFQLYGSFTVHGSGPYLQVKARV